MAGEYDKSQYTKKERFINFLDYFKVYLIAGVLILLFVGVQLIKIRAQKPIGFNAVYFNAVSTSMDEGQSYMDGFGQTIGLGEKQIVEVQNYMAFNLDDGVEDLELNIVQNMGAWIANGDLDVMLANEVVFEYFAYWGGLSDLRYYLSEETLQELEPYIFYIDQTVADARAEYMYGSEEYNSIQLPNPRDPASMKDPIPVGIYLDQANDAFKAEFEFENGTAMVGIFLNNENAERCSQFIHYIMK